MSKKKRHMDNSKRQQPVQQQRAQAAAQQAGAGKSTKTVRADQNDGPKRATQKKD